MVRHKSRYTVVEINPQKHNKDGTLEINSTWLQKAILNKLQQMHGDFGVAATKNGFTAKYFNEKTRIAIIRSRHGPHRLVASCLPFIQEVDGKRVNFNTLYTGATIRQCFRFILNYQSKKVEEICATLQSEEQKTAMKTDLLNLNALADVT